MFHLKVSLGVRETRLLHEYIFLNFTTGSGPRVQTALTQPLREALCPQLSLIESPASSCAFPESKMAPLH